MFEGLLDRLVDLFYDTASVMGPSVERNEAVVLFSPPQGTSALEVSRRLNWDYAIRKCAIGSYGEINGAHVFRMHVYSRQRRQVARLILTMGCKLYDGDLQRMQPLVRGLPKPKRRRRR